MAFNLVQNSVQQPIVKRIRERHQGFCPGTMKGVEGIPPRQLDRGYWPQLRLLTHCSCCTLHYSGLKMIIAGDFRHDHRWGGDDSDSFSPDSKHLVSGSDDCKVRLSLTVPNFAQAKLSVGAVVEARGYPYRHKRG